MSQIHFSNNRAVFLCYSLVQYMIITSIVHLVYYIYCFNALGTFISTFICDAAVTPKCPFLRDNKSCFFSTIHTDNIHIYRCAGASVIVEKTELNG